MRSKAEQVVEKMLDNLLSELEKETIPTEEMLEMARIALSYAFIQES